MANQNTPATRKSLDKAATKTQGMLDRAKATAERERKRIATAKKKAALKKAAAKAK